jgi:hypothetical protein
MRIDLDRLIARAAGHLHPWTPRVPWSASGGSSRFLTAEPGSDSLTWVGPKPKGWKQALQALDSIRPYTRIPLAWSLDGRNMTAHWGERGFPEDPLDACQVMRHALADLDHQMGWKPVPTGRDLVALVEDNPLMLRFIGGLTDEVVARAERRADKPIPKWLATRIGNCAPGTWTVHDAITFTTRYDTTAQHLRLVRADGASIQWRRTSMGLRDIRTLERRNARGPMPLTFARPLEVGEPVYVIQCKVGFPAPTLPNLPPPTAPDDGWTLRHADPVWPEGARLITYASAAVE